MAVVRYREKNSDISRKHGNTLIRTLRETYGAGFVPGCADHAKLSDVLTKLDEVSGKLEEICQGGHVRGSGTEPDISSPRAERG